MAQLRRVSWSGALRSQAQAWQAHDFDLTTISDQAELLGFDDCKSLQLRDQAHFILAAKILQDNGLRRFGCGIQTAILNLVPVRGRRIKKAVCQESRESPGCCSIPSAKQRAPSNLGAAENQ